MSDNAQSIVFTFLEMVETFLNQVCCKTNDVVQFIEHGDDHKTQRELIDFCNQDPSNCDISVGALLANSTSTQIAGLKYNFISVFLYSFAFLCNGDHLHDVE